MALALEARTAVVIGVYKFIAIYPLVYAGPDKTREPTFFSVLGSVERSSALPPPPDSRRHSACPKDRTSRTAASRLVGCSVAPGPGGSALGRRHDPTGPRSETRAPRRPRMGRGACGVRGVVLADEYAHGARCCCSRAAAMGPRRPPPHALARIARGGGEAAPHPCPRCRGRGDGAPHWSLGTLPRGAAVDGGRGHCLVRRPGRVKTGGPEETRSDESGDAAEPFSEVPGQVPEGGGFGPGW